MRELFAELAFTITRDFFYGGEYEGRPIQKGDIRSHNFQSDLTETSLFLQDLLIVRPVKQITNRRKKLKNKYEYSDFSSVVQLIINLEDIKEFIINKKEIYIEIDIFIKIFIIISSFMGLNYDFKPFIPNEKWMGALRSLEKYGYVKTFWEFSVLYNARGRYCKYIEYFEYTSKMLDNEIIACELRLNCQTNPPWISILE